MSVRAFYADWAGYNRRTIEGIRRLSVEDLALPVLALRDGGGDPWPIWAVAGHTAGVRVFWLCDVFGEPGAELTPFEGDTPGWEDDLSQPRTAEELAGAFESTWRVIEGCLERWTPDSLGQETRRDEGGRPPEIHTRQSILLRMITHEGYHLGEINLALGSNGREPINPWPGSDWEAGAARWRREG
ncbi:MAG TPA: DinB family protein [Patescibacteria group bacterium]|nr:DinB family protein [Patescibacteria group bacterium]